MFLSERIEELNLSLTETTKRAEEAERQLIILKSKSSVSENLVSVCLLSATFCLSQI